MFVMFTGPDPRFQDRADAGRRLAKALSGYRDRGDVFVLALPRGGVPVAFEVARGLGVELDVLNVRKLGTPGHEELAMGAVASGGVVFLNQPVIRGLGITQHAVEAAVERESQEVQRREKKFRGDRPFPDLCGRTAIVVDDGIATGSTVHAAIAALRQMQAGKIVIAVPVAAATTCEHLLQYADEVVCLLRPPNFYAIGEWYEDFDQLDDADVMTLLERPETHPRLVKSA